jgi:hypothetical protein
MPWSRLKSLPTLRAVVDALEKDMTSMLATKQDFRHYEELFTARLEALESRIVIKLSLVMAGMIGATSGLFALLR